MYARTRDPERALENRLGRDAVLAQRLAAAGDVVEISHVRETAMAVEARFQPVVADWLAWPDHGDIAARRRDEEDARERQRRSHAAHMQRRSE
jgi:hypothetical protein